MSDFYDPWVQLYDLMVDWDKRLAKEGPALAAIVESAGGRKVLDVACGTGRHLGWLAQAGFEVTGADISAEMIAAARTVTLGPAGQPPLFTWSMADEIPEKLAAVGPFDTVLCLGNSFPHLVEPLAVSTALLNFRSLLAPGGRLLLGLKALAVLRQANRPCLPLVKRQTEFGPVMFVRFYDFDSATANAADFHMVIIAPGQPLLAGSGGLHHAVTPLRMWWPDELAAAVAAAGFADVTVAADLWGKPWRPGDSEDVFVRATRT